MVMHLYCKKQLCTVLTSVGFMFMVKSSVAQNIPFIPPVYNYTIEQYNAGNQNWSIAQGNNGVIYFGNDNGMLSYDGVNWKLHSLPNNLSVKSIYIDSSNGDERIFVGSFEEFGYFMPDKTNQLVYHSISNNVEDHQFHNDEIWNIYPFNGKLYFQSFSTIFVYDDHEVEIQKPFPAVLYFFPAGEKMFAQMIDSDFCLFDGDDFQTVVPRGQMDNDNVIALLPYKDDWLLVTSKSGFFLFSEKKQGITKWRLPAWDELEKCIFNRAIVTDDAYILGTLNSGIYAIDKDGNLLWHIDRNNQLNNNTILALYIDREQTVWAALDNGISNVRIHSSLSFFEPSENQIGPVEDILLHNNHFYFATNQGVYHYSDKEKQLVHIPGFDNQSWFIKNFNKQIFVGHNQGTSFLEDLKEIPIPEAHTGGMDMKKATINGKNILLGSSYTTLHVYKQDQWGDWTFSNVVEGFSDLIKNLEIDQTGNIWAGHMYKGVYRLKLDEELHKVVETENFLSFNDPLDSDHHPINVMKLRGRIVFTDGDHFFTYDDIQHSIIPFDQLNIDLPGFADTYRIVPVNDNLFWFIRHNGYALIEYSGNKYIIKDRIPYSILNNPPNAGRANLMVAADNTSYFSMNGGIGKYSPMTKNTEVSTDLQIASITSHNRNKEQWAYLDPSQKGMLPFQNNNITVQFLYPEFSKKIFQVESYLKGYDSRWMLTDNNRTTYYHNLPSGDYILYAQVKDSSGKILSTVDYAFRIKSPWYKSRLAYMIYSLLVIYLSVFLVKRHIHTVIRKQNKLFEEQENTRLAQIERQEKEITALQNEKLEAELTHKGKELASAAMMLINHSEFLKNLRECIQTFILTGKINRIEGNELLSMIGKNIPEEDEWNLFQNNFDLIHENFFLNLKERYASLTPADLKLCALLRLNYSSKEIAEMLNISIRGVEAARYRLRKKLQLSETDNLVDFMLKFQ